MKILLSLVAAFAFQEVPKQAPPKLGACVLQSEGLREPTGVAFGADGLTYVSESLARQVSVIDDKGKTIRTLGKGTLVDPRDVASDGGEAVFVSDDGLDCVFRFGPDGKSSRFGEQGSDPGRFNGPEGLDASRDFVAVADSRNDRVQIFTHTGKFVRAIGSSGHADGELNHPTDVAFASDGSLFVTDLFNQRVQHFSKDGKFLRAFGSPGPNPGQFSGPTGIAVCGDYVHVVDRDNARVQIFTKDGELSSWYGIHALRPREGQGKLHYPLRVALNDDGTRAAIVEPMEDRVQILGPVDPNVEELPPLPALPPSHFGGAVDADGPILALVEPSIPKVLLFQMMDGEPIEFGAFGTYGSGAGQMLWPSDVAVDFAQRRVFVLDSGNGRVLAFEFKFDPAAEIGFDPERLRFVAQWEDGHTEPEGFPTVKPWRRFAPTALWRDGQGGLLALAAGSRRATRLDASLQTRGSIELPASCGDAVDGCAGPQGKDPVQARVQYIVDRRGGRVFATGSDKPVVEELSRPSAVLFTQGGDLYVSDEGDNLLLRIGKEKTVVARGPGLEPKQLFRPRGLCELSGGRVVVIDYGNHRGMIFDAKNEFVRAFGSQLFVRPAIKSFQSKAPEPAVPAITSPGIPQPAALDGSRPWHSAHRVLSNGGSYLVFWKSIPESIEEGKSFALEVWVTLAESPNEIHHGGELEIDAFMPDHGHGMNVVPKSTRADDGHFRVDGTRLQMPGRWELYFDFCPGYRTERAQVTLMLE